MEPGVYIRCMFGVIRKIVRSSRIAYSVLEMILSWTCGVEFASR